MALHPHDRDMEVSGARAAEQFFHEKIPVTRTMGARVVAAGTREFVVEAPVALNRNHLETAFGGSINAIATLAGYGALWLELRDSARIVIAESSVRFLRPLRETIKARCSPDSEAMEAFKRELRERGKARIRLAVVIEEDGTTAAEFTGVFVARLTSQERA